MTQTAELTASGASALGWTVAISGDAVIAGAYVTEVGNNTEQGSAYVYTRPPNGWTSTHRYSAELVAQNGQTYDYLGTSVAISGKVAAAGAPGATVGSNVGEGATYVFGSN